MTLMDAQRYDEARARRRRNTIIVVIIAVLVLAWVTYHLRDYPERHTADKFFAALQSGNVEGAYAIWLQDSDWKQHPQKYPKYTFGDFSEDWGPAGDWGIIKSHNVDCSYATASGVIVQVTVNGLSKHSYVWVEKSDETLHDSPTEVDCGNWFGWLTE
jgi:hypothetical protein